MSAGPLGTYAAGLFFLFAARATPADWLAFRREHGSETVDRGGEGGPGLVVEPLSEGAVSTARWSQPATRGIRAGRVVVGVAAQLQEADDFVYGAARQVAGRVGWVAWNRGVCRLRLRLSRIAG